MLAVLVIVVLVVAGALGYFAVTTNNTKVTSTSTSTGSSLSTLTSVIGTGYTGTTDITLQGGGSSYVNPIMQVWGDRFAGYTDGYVELNYQSIGSAAGQQGLFDGSFNYAGSDAPVTGSQLKNVTAANPGNTLLEFPDALGAVTIFYNVPQIGNTSLDLTGAILAGIWNESITKWNAPQIAALNPRVNLPDQTIIPVHRADGSGTTFAFTTYLNEIDPSWNATIGVGLIVNWPATELAGTGSAGVAGIVSTTNYTIGYADQYYATHNGLTVAAIKNSAGNFILPSLTTITYAVDNFTTQLEQNPLYPISNAPGSDSYPISALTYILVWKNQTNEQTAYAMYFFLWWIINDGQGYGTPLDFPPLPSFLVPIDNSMISQINYNGQTFTT